MVGVVYIVVLASVVHGVPVVSIVRVVDMIVHMLSEMQWAVRCMIVMILLSLYHVVVVIMLISPVLYIVLTRSFYR